MTEVASSLPWHVNIILAIAGYLLFHNLAAIDVQTARDVDGISTMITAQFTKSFSMFLQFIVPSIFGFGAILSAVNQRKRGNIYNKQSSIKSIRELDWKDFELLISEAYRKQGFQVTETDAGPDGGIDLVLRKDNRKIYVQCKHWKNYKVGVDKVRELNGVVAANGAYGGILVTSGIFTTEAINFAETCPIELIDGDKLFKLIPEIDIPNSVHTQSDATPSCPKCGSMMVKKTAKKGPKAGNHFWGCSTFSTTNCKGIINIE